MLIPQRRREFLATLAAGLAAGRPAARAAGWKSLFDGRTLAGWRQTGNAAWSVEDGAIVGRQGPGGAAGDLLTEEQWSDFEFEAEWKMRFPGNSGIWFRYTAPKSSYQADFLDQSSHPGVLSGSLYCPGKQFIAENRDPKTVNKNDWNTIRIRAAGDEITIHQNGVQVVHIHDDTISGPGSIGIQLHAGAQFANMEIRVRNVRLQSL